jgi:acetylornithine/N-succinyldiaminopimelate aminotransferase
MGIDLHLFIEPEVTSPEKLLAITPFEFQKIQPSLEDVFIALVRRQELALRGGIDAINADFDLFAEIRGRGLMLGAVLKPAYAGRAGEILDHAAAHGLLLLQAGPDVLRFVPPLTIRDGEVADGLVRLRAAIEAFVRGP